MTPDWDRCWKDGRNLRIEELEKENAELRKRVADLTAEPQRKPRPRAKAKKKKETP